MLLKKKFVDFLNLGPEIVPINKEILEIRDAYLKKAILKPKFANDLLHIAIATYANADVLVSWNFKHIVRFDKILLYNHGPFRRKSRARLLFPVMTGVMAKKN